MKIANVHFKSTMKDPKYQWAYLRTCHQKEFDDLQSQEIDNTNQTEISINIEKVRVIENE